MDTPISDEAIRTAWPAFANAVRLRLDTGRRQYGDASFTRPVHELLNELSQELLDQAGWAFIGWQRIQSLLNSIELSLPAGVRTDEPVGRVEANL
jgi:hypothetical protein